MLIADNFEKSKYYEGVRKLTHHETWIYVEGNNKNFYQSLEEFSRFPIKGNNTCDEIIRLVNQYNNIHGILDLDYCIHDMRRLYQIDYYSVENISLVHDTRYNPIVEKIKQLLIIHTVESSRAHKINVEINKDANNIPIDIEFKLSPKKHHDQFQDYICKRIKSSSDFIRYIDLKTVVEKSSKFLRQVGILNKIDYIDKLHEKLTNPKIKMLFSEETFNKVNNELLIRNH